MLKFWKFFFRLIPKKDGTPKKYEVVFIAPIGDEFKTKKAIKRYLKKNPGGSSISEFDWSMGKVCYFIGFS